MADKLRVLESMAKSTGNSVIQWAADEIARLREERRWISVEERLPDVGVDVLAISDEGVFQARLGGLRDDYRWQPLELEFHGCGCCGGFRPNVTHWQPLPAPTSEGEVDG